MTDSPPSLLEVHTQIDDLKVVPAGFRFAAVRCGIKQSRPDLALLLCEQPTATAGCFTQNKVRAACVDRNASLLPSKDVRAVVINSGNANAMTGAEGIVANETMATTVASRLGIASQTLLTGSTGIIGVPLPTTLITDAADALTKDCNRDPMRLAGAIITTDTVTKVAHLEVTLPEHPVPIRILGVAKGSGMVHPNMATTFGFVMTDAEVAPELLQQLLGQEIAETFNAISVDGDTSTNDMVLALASGRSEQVVTSPAQIAAFAQALGAVLNALARQVAADGEGATRLLEVTVDGAPDRETARTIARGVCRSSLVKSSAFSGQPEWGRIGMAVGQVALEQGYDIDLTTMKISSGDTMFYDGDGPHLGVNTSKLRAGLSQTEVKWRIDLGCGEASATALGCDLTYDYVRINADEAKQIEITRGGGVTRNLSLAAYSPRLKHQLLCEGLAYVRRFTGLRIMVHLQAAALTASRVETLAHDLELCLDAGLRPIVILPDTTAQAVITEHITKTGLFAAVVSPDPSAITRCLDRGHLCLLVRESPAPDAVVDLALKLGIQKLITLCNSQGLLDNQGLVQRLSPETFRAGLERGRFNATEPDVLVMAKHAATRGVPAFHVVDGRVAHAVVGELFTDEGIGTLITRQAFA